MDQNKYNYFLHHEQMDKASLKYTAIQRLRVTVTVNK